MHIIPSYLENVCLRLKYDDPGLTQLDLGTSQISTDGAIVLRQVLRENTKLRHLGLWNNQLDAKGIAALAEGLMETTCRLEVLYLGDNHIGNVGAEALGAALAQNTSLKRIYLANGRIGAAGARALANGLRANTTLEFMDLRHNDIGKEGYQAFRWALEYNNLTLKTLQVDSPTTTKIHCQKDAAAIETYLKLNRFGRMQILRDSTLSENLWPLILSRATNQPEILFLLLNDKPCLLRRQG